ncbi:MAG: hypothetical protein M3N43_01785 [Actinomycetota bacterium]|nr:hypothetical protein [Actinomycetota bacterium]
MAREQQRHKLPRDVDQGILRDRLSARLGRPVELLASPPADGDGAAGELIICDRDTDEWLHVDPAVVQSVVGLAPAAPTSESSEQRLLADMAGAVGVDEQLVAIRDFLQRAVDAGLAVRAKFAELSAQPGQGVTVDIANREVIADNPLQPSDFHTGHVSAFGHRTQRRPR